MTTDNTVMWATRLSIVGWVYSKTQILLATLRTQNQPGEEEDLMQFWKVAHLYPLVGCVRSKRQYPTDLQDHKNISLDAGLRMDGLPAHDVWDVVTEV